MILLNVDRDRSLDAQYKEAMKEWRHVRLKGNDTKCWPDGMYMNLVRSKIIRLSKMKKNEIHDADFSGWEIPEKVDFEYNHRQSYKKGNGSER